MKCSQCNNTAIYQTAIGLLCLNCAYKLQQMQQNELANQERMINWLMDEIDMITGIPLNSPRFPERKPPVIQAAPVTLHSISIDRSVVGNVNTGYIQQLEVSMSSVTQTNNDGADKVKEFAEAVLKENKLSKEHKEEIVQQLSFLVQQLRLEDSKRNKGVIKAVVSGIGALINTSASLLTLWEPVKNLFGL